MFREGLEHLVKVHGVALLPWGDGPFADGEPRVGHDEVLVEEDLGPQAVAVGAGPVGAVEGEHPRRQFGQAHVAVGAGVALAEEKLPALCEVGLDESVGETGRDLQGVAQSLADSLADEDPVDDDVDVVAFAFVQGDFVGQVPDRSVDLHPHVALAAQAVQLFLEFALLAAHDGGQQRNGRSGRQGQDLLHHRVDGLRADLAAALEAVGGADAGVKEAQVVVDLRDGAHRRPGIVACASLLDGNGRREPLDGLHLGFVHLADELAGIGGQGFHVAALPLGVDRVESERRFARAAHAGDDDETVPGDVQADILEVVLGCTLDANVFHNDSNPPLCRPDPRCGAARQGRNQAWLRTPTGCAPGPPFTKGYKRWIS